MSKNGYTTIQNLPYDTYIIKAVFNSLVLGEVGQFDVDNESSWFEQFRVPRSRPIDVRVFYEDRRTPLSGPDIIVETNRVEGGPVRGGDSPEYRILTNKHGLAKIWLFPAMHPQHDFYVIKVRHGGIELARKEYHLGHSGNYKRHIDIFTELSFGEDKMTDNVR